MEFTQYCVHCLVFVQDLRFLSVLFRMTTIFDIHQAATIRAVTAVERDGRDAYDVVLQCDLGCEPNALWEALTDSSVLAKWFLPVTGDLRLGGQFAFEHNASGTIIQCEPQKSFQVTWEFGGTSWVECRVNGGTLTIIHTSHVSDHWQKYGPSATGVGWEMAATSLRAFLSGSKAPTNEEFSNTQQGRAFIRQSCESWAAAHIKGAASEVDAKKAAENTAQFYTGESAP